MQYLSPRSNKQTNIVNDKKFGFKPFVSKITHKLVFLASPLLGHDTRKTFLLVGDTRVAPMKHRQLRQAIEQAAKGSAP
jgi:hypothetical protein